MGRLLDRVLELGILAGMGYLGYQAINKLSEGKPGPSPKPVPTDGQSPPSIAGPGPTGCSAEELTALAERWVRGEVSDAEFNATLVRCGQPQISYGPGSGGGGGTAPTGIVPASVPAPTLEPPLGGGVIRDPETIWLYISQSPGNYRPFSDREDTPVYIPSWVFIKGIAHTRNIGLTVTAFPNDPAAPWASRVCWETPQRVMPKLSKGAYFRFISRLPNNFNHHYGGFDLHPAGQAGHVWDRLLPIGTTPQAFEKELIDKVSATHPACNDFATSSCNLTPKIVASVPPEARKSVRIPGDQAVLDVLRDELKGEFWPIESWWSILALRLLPGMDETQQKKPVLDLMRAGKQREAFFQLARTPGFEVELWVK